MRLPLDVLRNTKHRAFVATKHARWAARDARIALEDRRWAALEKKHPYRYDPALFAHTFLAREAPTTPPLEAAPHRLWTIWLGGTPTPARQTSLDALAAQPDVEVMIVRQSRSVELPEHPFHPAFDHLTSVHKSDYLRAYLMHHYGGAYIDVKPMRQSIRPLIDQLNGSGENLALGYAEITSEYAAHPHHELRAALRRHYRALMGPSMFIFKPQSPFTAEWMRELHARLDYLADPLAEADAANADPYATPAAYPIWWTEILGDILHPLSLKYRDSVVLTPAAQPVLQNYR